ncbi:MAG TPA: ribosomal-processing cysteine protease Prp [Bacillota bacterium]|jgi:uncharacterized protein YsxB (DUF464 family)|nr:ribosomal-processing cysteine protease Prp [Bacillota bacterium]HQD74189.1 ribosomal-processing cysteine protease Prp [Bacillota bacterium]
MLKVQFLRKPARTDKGENSDILVGFIIKGHAGFADHGEDIVCAGASAIAQSALLGLQDLYGDRVYFRREPGFLEVHMDVEDAAKTECRTIMRVLELGLLSISQAYIRHIDITYENL